MCLKTTIKHNKLLFSFTQKRKEIQFIINSCCYFLQKYLNIYLQLKNYIFLCSQPNCIPYRMCLRPFFNLKKSLKFENFFSVHIEVYIFIYLWFISFLLSNIVFLFSLASRKSDSRKRHMEQVLRNQSESCIKEAERGMRWV